MFSPTSPCSHSRFLNISCLTRCHREAPARLFWLFKTPRPVEESWIFIKAHCQSKPFFVSYFSAVFDVYRPESYLSWIELRMISRQHQLPFLFEKLCGTIWGLASTQGSILGCNEALSFWGALRNLRFVSHIHGVWSSCCLWYFLLDTNQRWMHYLDVKMNMRCTVHLFRKLEVCN